MGGPSRDDEAAVRALLCEWDVIGLREEDSPRDEYDCRNASPWSLRARGAPADEITGWMGREAMDHFGLASSTAAHHRMARAVLALP